MTHELIVDSVAVRFGEKTVVSGGYVTARTGSVTGLLGRNGAGKSCMFRALMGGLKVDYVSVHADGKPVDIGKIGLTVKYLPQDFWAFVLLFPKYSGKYHARLWEMSGGEARLAELYLVLMAEAPFCILDEPFSQIDPVHIEAVQRLIREKCRENGIIVTDHNYEALSTVADQLYVLSDGYTHPVETRDDLVRYGYLLPQ